MPVSASLYLFSALPTSPSTVRNRRISNRHPARSRAGHAFPRNRTVSQRNRTGLKPPDVRSQEYFSCLSGCARTRRREARPFPCGGGGEFIAHESEEPDRSGSCFHRWRNGDRPELPAPRGANRRLAPSPPADPSAARGLRKSDPERLQGGFARGLLAEGSHLARGQRRTRAVAA
jgi:hypothetical protein